MSLSYLLAGLSCFGQSTTDASGETASTGTSPWLIVVYVVVFGVFIYFLMIRPQRKQKKQQEERMTGMEPGDSVLTTSGFYGTIVAINEDTIIVEFGNNKNCRIPMAKQAISQVEKANAGTAVAAAAGNSTGRKFFGGKKKSSGDQIDDAIKEVEEQTIAAAPAESKTGSSEGSSEDGPKDAE